MNRNQQPVQDGANWVTGVDEDIATRRRPASSTPFNGRPIIYGAVGSIAFIAVLLLGVGLALSGSGVWAVLLAIPVLILGIRLLRRL